MIDYKKKYAPFEFYDLLFELLLSEVKNFIEYLAFSVFPAPDSPDITIA
jgi:hypothetical protein